jgi:hypothetical protein
MSLSSFIFVYFFVSLSLDQVEILKKLKKGRRGIYGHGSEHKGKKKREVRLGSQDLITFLTSSSIYSTQGPYVTKGRMTPVMVSSPIANQPKIGNQVQ